MGELALGLLAAGKRIATHTLHDVPSEFGFERGGIGSVVSKREGRVLELGQHLVDSERSQTPALLGRGGVLAVLHRGSGKGLAGLKLGVDLVDLLLGVGVGFGFRVKNKNVRRLHGVARRTLARHANEVVAKLCTDRAHNLTLRGRVHRRLKGVDHAKDGEPAQIASALGAVGVGAQGRELGKWLAAVEAVLDAHNLLVGPQGVARKRILSTVNHDVAGTHVPLHTLVGLLNEALVHIFVGQVGLEQLLVVAVVFVNKRRHGVAAHGLCRSHFALELHVEVEVFGLRFGVNIRPNVLVFAVDVLEFRH